MISSEAFSHKFAIKRKKQCRYSLNILQNSYDHFLTQWRLFAKAFRTFKDGILQLRHRCLKNDRKIIVTSLENAAPNAKIPQWILDSLKVPNVPKWRPWADVIKLFTAVIRNKLECSTLASLSSLVYCMLARPGVYPGVKHSKSFFRVGSCFFNKQQTRLERLGRDKHSGLLSTLVNYGRKIIYNIGPRVQCYKTLFIFVTSK